MEWAIWLPTLWVPDELESDLGGTVGAGVFTGTFTTRHIRTGTVLTFDAAGAVAALGCADCWWLCWCTWTSWCW